MNGLLSSSSMLRPESPPWAPSAWSNCCSVRVRSCLQGANGGRSLTHVRGRCGAAGRARTTIDATVAREIELRINCHENRCSTRLAVQRTTGLEVTAKIAAILHVEKLFTIAESKINVGSGGGEKRACLRIGQADLTTRFKSAGSKVRRCPAPEDKTSPQTTCAYHDSLHGLNLARIRMEALHAIDYRFACTENESLPID